MDLIVLGQCTVCTVVYLNMFAFDMFAPSKGKMDVKVDHPVQNFCIMDTAQSNMAVPLTHTLAIEFVADCFSILVRDLGLL